MSRTIKGKRGPARSEYSSRRLPGWPNAGKLSKKRTHKKERRDQKKTAEA